MGVKGPQSFPEGLNLARTPSNFLGGTPGDRATTAIWELEIFWWQAQSEGDRATTTAVWELEIFWRQANPPTTERAAVVY